jgi:ParB-like chromosome segregation protein Spo0J
MATQTPWRSRIIGHGEEAPDQLLANPLNFRIHPKPQQDALAGVLNEVGWVQDVIVNQRTGHVIDGHLRVSLAISRQEPSIPVVYVDLNEHEEKLILATIDPLSAMAATDRDQLSALLSEVSTGDAALRAMLSDLADSAGIPNGAGS